MRLLFDQSAGVRLRSAAVLAPMLLTGCFSLGGAPISEVAELVAMGGERALEQPPTPIRGTTRVLLFALDGVSGETLTSAIRDGRMPHLAELLGADRGDGLFDNAYATPAVLSILPSTTVPAWTTVFTGTAPAVHGIPGNEWFDRRERRFYAPVPITVQSRSHASKLYTDALLSDLVRVPTLYEKVGHLRSHVSANPVFRGADILTVPDVGSFGDLTQAVIAETLAGSARKSATVARETDETSLGSLRESIRKRGVPDLQVVYFNGIDLRTHYAEQPIQDQLSYLEVVTDPLIGEVLQLYREMGALEDTYVLVVSDHGHTPVIPDDRHAVSAAGADELAPVLEQAGFRVRPFSLTDAGDAFQAVFAYQGFMSFVYLADRSTCMRAEDRCDWTLPPRREDLLTAALALHRASESGAAVPEMAGTLDLVFARLGSGENESIGVFDGAGFVPLTAYLRRNPRPDLPDLERRMRNLLIGPYGYLAGDLVLLAKTGMDRPIEERFYFGSEQQSEHGGAHPRDSLTPLVVAHPRLDGGEIRERVRKAVGPEPTQLDITPLVQALLER